MCVILLAAVVRPGPIIPTSAPHTTVHKIPDVLLQPPKIRTDTFRKTLSGSPPHTRAEVWKTNPVIYPNRSKTTKNTTLRQIPGISQNPQASTAETEKSITMTTPIVSQTKTKASAQNLGIKLNPSTTTTDSFKNTSGITLDQVRPALPKISNAIAKTSIVTQPPGNNRPASGKPKVSNSLYQL